MKFTQGFPLRLEKPQIPSRHFCNVEIQTNQTRKATNNHSKLEMARESVTNTYIFEDSQKQAERRKHYRGQKEGLQACCERRLLARGAHRKLARYGTAHVAGRGYNSGFLWLILSQKLEQKSEKVLHMLQKFAKIESIAIGPTLLSTSHV